MRRNDVWSLSIFLIGCITLAGLLPAGPAGSQKDIIDYCPGPAAAGGWRPADSPQAAVGEDLFLLINGGAEIVHEYGFCRAVFRQYKNRRGNTLNLEIYEMKDSFAAYGIYTFKTGETGREIDIGNGALLEDYYLNAWKGRFLVTVIGFDSEAETLEGLITVARSVVGKIDDKGELPGLVKLLPKENLKKNGITYLRGHLAFYNRYGFDSRDLFRLEEGIMGRYGSAAILIFKYPSREETRERFKTAAAHIKNKPRCRDLQSRKNTLSFTFIDPKERPRRIYMKPCGRYILMVSGASEAEITPLLKRVEKNACSPF